MMNGHSSTHRTAVRERTLHTDGLNIRVVITGPSGGVPLLLINGLGARMQSWLQFQDGLRDRRVVLFDLPDDPSAWSAPVRMRSLGKRVARLLDSLDIPLVDVLGYSWGGALAQQLALDEPDRVRGLVLAATNYGVGSFPVAPGPLLRLVTGRSTSGETLGGFLGLLVGTGPAAFESSSCANYLQQLFAFAGWSSILRLRSLRQPTLVLAGDQDPLIPVCTTRLMGMVIPAARVEIMPDAGHSFLLFDRSGEACAIVEAFLRELDVNERSSLTVAGVS